MVLIDASHPDQWTRTPDGAAVQRNNEVSASIAPLLARIGLLRTTNFIKVDPDLPTQQQAEMRAFMNATRVWDSDHAVFQAGTGGTAGAILADGHAAEEEAAA